MLAKRLFQLYSTSGMATRELQWFQCSNLNTIPNVTTWSVFEIFLKRQNELRIAKGSLSTSIASSAVTAAQ